MIGRKRDEWQEQYDRWQALKKAKLDKRSITERIMEKRVVQPEPIIQEVESKKEEKKEEIKKVEIESVNIKKHRNFREIIAERRARDKGRSEADEILKASERIDVDLK